MNGQCIGCGRWPPFRGEDLDGDLPVELTVPTLAGWHPCVCGTPGGGHATRWCDSDQDGCGAEVWDPPRDWNGERRCSDPSQGFG